MPLNRDSVIGTPTDMTVEQLEARIRIHLSTFEMFKERGEFGTAKTFRQLAAVYQNELDNRLTGPVM